MAFVFSTNCPFSYVFIGVAAMLNLLFRNAIAKQESLFKVSLDYLRHMLATSTSAFIKFNLLMPMAQHRQALPVAGQAVAALMGSRSQDCGPCVQITVNMALHYGVDAAVLRAVLEDHPSSLPDELVLVYRFAQAVLMKDAAADALRDDVRAQWGDAGVLDIAFAIASSQVYPITKRVLGFGKSCTLVQIEADSQHIATTPILPLADPFAVLS